MTYYMFHKNFGHNMHDSGDAFPLAEPKIIKTFKKHPINTNSYKAHLQKACNRYKQTLKQIQHGALDLQCENET